jgi:hypothetical protein
MPKPNARIHLRLTRSSNNTLDPEAQAPFSLIVEDAKSGLTFAEITLTPNDLADLLSNRLAGDLDTGLDAWLLDSPHRANLNLFPARVSRRVDRREFDDLDEAARWADQVQRHILAVSRLAPSPDNALGVRFAFSAYFDTEDGARTWADSAQNILDKAPTPAELRKAAAR